MTPNNAPHRKRLNGHWLGPWRLYVIDAEWCEWKRDFRRDGFPRTVYISSGPMVPNVTGHRWGMPRTGRVPRGTIRDSDYPEGFSPAQLMGVRRDGDITVHGELIGVTDIVTWPERTPA